MRRRRAIISLIVGTIAIVLLAGAMPRLVEESFPLTAQQQITSTEAPTVTPQQGTALAALQTLEEKGRAPKTGYERAEFGDGWDTVNGCTTRNIILHRDLQNPVVDEACRVTSGTLADAYTGETISFSSDKASAIQIDHVVALSDAWQKGAQLMPKERRIQLANDPLELLAVSGAQNQAKSDGDAATWLPKNKAFRCEYIARQIAVKVKYSLWVTPAEKIAMQAVLNDCPDQLLPTL